MISSGATLAFRRRATPASVGSCVLSLITSCWTARASPLDNHSIKTKLSKYDQISVILSWYFWFLRLEAYIERGLIGQAEVSSQQDLPSSFVSVERLPLGTEYEEPLVCWGSPARCLRGSEVSKSVAKCVRYVPQAHVVTLELALL